MDAEKPRKRWTRRRFIRHAVGWSALAAFGYAWRIEPHWVDVVRRELPIGHLPGDLVGRTLVQISDLHIGETVDFDYIVSALQRVAAMNADIVAITGDFMTCHDTEQIENVTEAIQHLGHGRFATLAIFGNHDYSLNWSKADVADQLEQKLSSAGVQVLRNASVNVAGLTIAGLDDFWGPRFDPESVLAALHSKDVNLVLCHNPDVADLPIWKGYQGWILSGHTHGGQCKPPFLPPPILPVRNRRYTAGEIDLNDGRRLYINRGLGYFRRVRFNVRPEITVFALTRAEAVS
jgi:uncharacterized protein